MNRENESCKGFNFSVLRWFEVRQKICIRMILEVGLLDEIMISPWYEKINTEFYEKDDEFLEKYIIERSKMSIATGVKGN